jgi:hypothetical protein
VDFAHRLVKVDVLGLHGGLDAVEVDLQAHEVPEDEAELDRSEEDN